MAIVKKIGSRVLFVVSVCCHRARTGRRPKTFWSWWCPAQRVWWFLMRCSAPTAQSLPAPRRSLSPAYSTTHLKSCQEKRWTSTLTSQRCLACHFLSFIVFVCHCCLL